MGWPLADMTFRFPNRRYSLRPSARRARERRHAAGALIDRIVSLYTASRVKATQAGHYEGWAPSYDGAQPKDVPSRYVELVLRSDADHRWLWLCRVVFSRSRVLAIRDAHEVEDEREDDCDNEVDDQRVERGVARCGKAT